MDNSDLSDSPQYQIQINGHLDERWVSYFGGLELATGFDTDGTPITTLSGPVVDQAALHGLLNRIRDSGLKLRGVNRLDIDSEKTND